MNEMVERVARAIDPQPFERVNGGQPGRAWMNGFEERTAESDRRRISKARRQARAAIEAMRPKAFGDLPEAVAIAGEAAIDRSGHGSLAAAHEVMAAMITAALKDPS